MHAMVCGPSPLPIKNTFIDFQHYDMPLSLPGRCIRSWDADRSDAENEKRDGNAPSCSTSHYTINPLHSVPEVQALPGGPLPPYIQHCRVPVGTLMPSATPQMASQNGNHMRPGGSTSLVYANHVSPAGSGDSLGVCSNMCHMGHGSAQPLNSHNVQLSNVHMVHRFCDVDARRNANSYDAPLSNAHVMHHSNAHDVQLSTVHGAHHPYGANMPISDVHGVYHPNGHDMQLSNANVMHLPNGRNMQVSIVGGVNHPNGHDMQLSNVNGVHHPNGCNMQVSIVGGVNRPNGRDMQLSDVVGVHHLNARGMSLSNVHEAHQSNGHDVQLANVHGVHHPNGSDTQLHNRLVAMPPNGLSGMHPNGYALMPSSPLTMIAPRAMMSPHMVHHPASPHSMMSPHTAMLPHGQMSDTVMPTHGLAHASPDMMNSDSACSHAEQRADLDIGLRPCSPNSFRTHWEDIIDDSDVGSIEAKATDGPDVPCQIPQSHKASSEDKYGAKDGVNRNGRSVTSPKEHDVKEFTTLMLRNIPARYSQEQLLADLEKMGFKGECFDFFYLPVDFGTRRNLGYAFVNCVTSKIALSFCNDIDRKTLPRYWAGKVIEVMPAAVQGFALNVERFLNGPSKRIGNPYFRPIIFIDGVGCPLTQSSVHKKATNSYNIKYR